MRIVTIETPSLGDRSYVVHDGRVALVVDPQRDIDRIEDVLRQQAVELVAVVETHVHNDYVSGGLELAAQHGATYHVAAAEDVAWERVATRDGDEVKVGALIARAVHTPGHTPAHLSWVISEDGQDHAVFTGGGLLYGSVGRTDLISADMTELLTRDQFRSAHRLADGLADDVAVLPTHGFGSFCSSGETSGSEHSTIGQERRDNQALRTNDEDAFVAELLAGLDAWPAYYVHMGPANRSGPGPVDLSPVGIVDPAEVRRRVHAGEWVVDLRSRRAFAHGHLAGTISIELDDSMSTHLGWLIEWGTPVTLVGEAEQQVADAQRQLVRIGIDHPAGQVRPADLRGPDERAYPVTDFAGLRAAIDMGTSLQLLDARRRLEWEEGHLDGALHIPLHELLTRLREIPPGTIWVHCASGYRAAIAASLLERAGRDVVLVDADFAEAHRHFDVMH